MLVSACASYSSYGNVHGHRKWDGRGLLHFFGEMSSAGRDIESGLAAVVAQSAIRISTGQAHGLPLQYLEQLDESQSSD